MVAGVRIIFHAAYGVWLLRHYGTGEAHLARGVVRADPDERPEQAGRSTDNQALRRLRAQGASEHVVEGSHAGEATGVVADDGQRGTALTQLLDGVADHRVLFGVRHEQDTRTGVVS